PRTGTSRNQATPPPALVAHQTAARTHSGAFFVLASHRLPIGVAAQDVFPPMTAVAENRYERYMLRERGLANKRPSRNVQRVVARALDDRLARFSYTRACRLVARIGA